MPITSAAVSHGLQANAAQAPKTRVLTDTVATRLVEITEAVYIGPKAPDFGEISSKGTRLIGEVLDLFTGTDAITDAVSAEWRTQLPDAVASVIEGSVPVALAVTKLIIHYAQAQKP